eukprot:g3229.t1
MIGGFGPQFSFFGDVAPWVNLKLNPGFTDQRTALSFKKTLHSICTLRFFFYSPNLIWFSMALCSHVLFPYDMDSDLTSFDGAKSWMLTRFIYNYVIAFTYYGFFHYGLYWADWGKRKYIEGSYPTAGNMMHNLWYWSLGIGQWTMWEFFMTRIWKSGSVSFVTNEQMLQNNALLAYNVLWILIIPIYRDLHFYIAHRFIHIRAIYKYVHSLHHRNADPEPFSGLTMHPIEHIYYFSCAFIPSLYLSNLSPLIFLWNFIHLTIAPGAGHSGFEDNWQSDQYHYLHHAKFECNYGSPFSGFIDQAFGTFREKLGRSNMYTGGAKKRSKSTDTGVGEEKKIAATTEKQLEKMRKPKEWSPKAYLGMPASTTDLIYTVYWASLIPLLCWGSLLNHKSPMELHTDKIGGFHVSTVVGWITAYCPVFLALLLCKLSGDTKSWRWPFQREKIFGAFGLFIFLGWVFVILPVYHTTKYVCTPGI